MSTAAEESCAPARVCDGRLSCKQIFGYWSTEGGVKNDNTDSLILVPFTPPANELASELARGSRRHPSV